MIPLSIVIIAKNEAAVMDRCLQSVQGISDDIMVCDTGSTDDTRAIAARRGARIVDMVWKGYGATKNEAQQLARHDWILQLDADEMIDDTLRTSLPAINWQDDRYAYVVKRKRYYMGRHMRFGAWGHEKKTRIFLRQNARWTHDPVHEKLEILHGKTQRIPGHILDITYQNPDQFNAKMQHYAQCCATKYFEQKKTGAAWKRFLSPLYTFLLNYILRLGILDGKEGLLLALQISHYTYLKYNTLHRMQKSPHF
jgi:glycosyltransferase involved in cell wall biosynthesis